MITVLLVMQSCILIQIARTPMTGWLSKEAVICGGI